MNNVTISEIISTIASYNGHEEWLDELAAKLDICTQQGEYYSGGLPVDEWHTDKHAIWMILVQLFGDWGTSVRSGWISETKECADFIRELLEEYYEAPWNERN